MKDNMDIFMENAEIPAVVTKKAQAAFDQIKKEAAGSASAADIPAENVSAGRTVSDSNGGREAFTSETATAHSAAREFGSREAFASETAAAHGDQASSASRAPHRRPRSSHRKYIVVGLAAALAVGGAAFASDQVFHWSRGIQGSMQASDEQLVSAQKSGLSDTPAEIEILSESEVKSVTKDGITISADQTLVDNYRAIISLKIHGISLPEGETPNIPDISCTIDGVDANWSGGFYDGTTTAADNTVIYDDGTSVDWNAENPLRYTDENGDYEFDIYFTNDGEAGAMIGKQIHISIFGIDEQYRNEEKEQYEEKVLTSETFDLHWTLKGTDQIRIVTFGGAEVDTRNFAEGADAEQTTEAAAANADTDSSQTTEAAAANAGTDSSQTTEATAGSSTDMAGTQAAETATAGTDAEPESSADMTVSDMSGSGAQAHFTAAKSDHSGAIGDTGAVLQQAEISPISIRLTMNWPYQDETEMGVDEDGNEFTSHTWATSPTLFALKMQDGTVMADAIDGTAMEGYTDEASGTYVNLINLKRIIDPDEVSALLFLKPEAVQKVEDYAIKNNNDRYDLSILTEEDFYSVDL